MAWGLLDRPEYQRKLDWARDFQTARLPVCALFLRRGRYTYYPLVDGVLNQIAALVSQPAEPVAA